MAYQKGNRSTGRRAIAARDQVYLRNLWMLLLCMTGLVAFTALALLYNFESIATRIVFRDALTLMEQTQINIGAIVDNGQKLTVQISQDYSIKHLRSHNPPTEREKAVNLEQLARYQHIMKMVDSIYLYNLHTGQMYTSRVISTAGNRIVSVDEFADPQAIDIILAHDDFRPFFPIPRVVDIPGEGTHTYYTFYGYDLMDKTPDKALSSAVIVNISTDQVRLAVGAQAGETLILDGDGRVVSDSQTYPMLTSLAALSPFDSIIGDEGSGYRIARLGDERVFLAYTAPDFWGWRYARIIPYAVIMAEITQIRMYTVLIGLAIVLVGLYLVWLLNRAVYKPIEAYKIDLDGLRAQERERAFQIRHDFLRALLTDHHADLSEESLKTLAAYQVGLPPAAYYIAVIKLDQYDTYVESHSSEDRRAYRFAILNIGEELCGKAGFLASGVDMRGNHLALLITRSGGAADGDIDALQGCLVSLRDIVQEHLSLSISSAISAMGDAPENLGVLYGQAIERVAHGRLFAGYGCVLPPALMDDEAEAAYVYPEKKEKQLLDALSRAQLEKAKQIYRDMLEECAGLTFQLLTISISRLALLVNRVWRSQLPQGTPASDILRLPWEHIETRSDLDRLFDAALEATVAQAQQETGSRADVLVQAIDAIIAERYTDPSLSIESIADALHMSASYIGRIYAKRAYHTIVERILQLRIGHACTLLLDTQMPISTIAGEVGFASDSYFFRMFKREKGMTPAAFRRGGGSEDNA